jgi:hypothetical protein
LQLAEHLQAYRHKWLRNINEKSSLSQAIVKVKALEQKYRSSERSVAAPPVLQQHIPITPYELSGQVSQSSFAVGSEYDSIIVDEHENITSCSSSSIVHHFPLLDTSHISDAGPSNQPRTSSKKRKPDDSLNSQQAAKKSRQERTCQKCGSQNCAGKGSRKYCKNPCQDCGDVDCSGRNSQHPKKLCTNELNEFIMYY